MILGGTHAARSFFLRLLVKVFPGEVYSTGATTAELAKYAANLHWATRVTLVSELAAVAESFGVDWEAVRSAWLLDARVNPAHTAMAGYGPGFGGRCWPKDLSALIAAADAAGYKAGFLEAVQEANARFRP
jgi:UDP-glucose 6-dehydrogenase